jgi:hypothetical protein
MADNHTGEWYLYFNDDAFPNYLLIKATGSLDGSFYVSLLADLEAYMAAKVGLRARYIPLIFDVRACYPTREGFKTLQHLIRRRECRAGSIILWISQRGPNSPVLHSASFMLRTLLDNVHIVYHLDEAFGLIGVPQPPPQPARLSLLARLARLTF